MSNVDLETRAVIVTLGNIRTSLSGRLQEEGRLSLVKPVEGSAGWLDGDLSGAASQCSAAMVASLTGRFRHRRSNAVGSLEGEEGEEADDRS